MSERCGFATDITEDRLSAGLVPEQQRFARLIAALKLPGASDT